MSSQFPRSPRLRKGGLVAYRLPAPVPVIIPFQYNPEQVSRSIAMRGAAGGGKGESQRVSGPPDETLSFTIEIDATDQLETPGSNAAKLALGLHPVIAALELLMYPKAALVAVNEGLALGGLGFIAAEQAPLTLLIWGAARVLPVRMESLTIKEQAFDENLNPIRVAADISLKVQTYRDLDMTSPAYWVYMAGYVQKEVLAAGNTIGSGAGIADMLPI